MRRLFDIVILFKEYLLLALYVVIAIALMAVNDTTQIRTIRSLTVASIGFLQDAFGFIPNYFELARENRALRELNVSLADEVSRLREARLENLRLQKLLGLKEQSPLVYVSANVTGRNLQLLQNTITIDAGESDGVQVNMPIVTDAGLVGRVVATSAGYAIGQILLHKDFRASAKVQRGRVDGILLWDGGPTLTLKNVAKTLDVQVGDAVITSEYSSLYPPGIKIGVVSKTSQAPGALFQTVEIAPSVDFSRLEEVFVVLHQPDSSRAALEQQFFK
ncbi:MAG TPA: rod shape-determining protein MreC [Bacteroidota bacterium]|nr:rod shape-determining protein MreC [Bacteroidota bacterium]